MNKEVRAYARQILTDNDCDEYTYGTSAGEQIIQELKEAYPDGLQYPYIDVANAIIDISKRRHITRSEWRVMWDTESASDSYDAPSFEWAKDDVLSTLSAWACDEAASWQSDVPTKDEINRWDFMIYNCSAWVSKYNPGTDEYDHYWEPTPQDLSDIGWFMKGEEE